MHKENTINSAYMNLFFDILQLLGWAIIAFWYIPQVSKTLKTWDVSGFSINYLILTSVWIFLMLMYSVYAYILSGNSWALLATTIVTFSLSVIMLSVVVYFKYLKDLQLNKYCKYNLSTWEMEKNF